jgi:hypothetical protein
MALCIPVQAWVFLRNLYTSLTGGRVEVREQITSETS